MGWVVMAGFARLHRRIGAPFTGRREAVAARTTDRVRGRPFEEPPLTLYQANPSSRNAESSANLGFRGPFAKQAAAFARVGSPQGRRFSTWFGGLMACSSYDSLKA